MKRNITVSIDAEVAERVRVEAGREGVTVSAYVNRVMRRDAAVRALAREAAEETPMSAEQVAAYMRERRRLHVDAERRHDQDADA